MSGWRECGVRGLTYDDVCELGDMSVLQSFQDADLRLEIIEQLGGKDRARDRLDGHSSACLLLADVSG